MHDHGLDIYSDPRLLTTHRHDLYILKAKIYLLFQGVRLKLFQGIPGCNSEYMERTADSYLVVSDHEQLS